MDRRRRESGAALLVLISLLLLACAVALAERRRAASGGEGLADAASARRLAQARSGLIAWSATLDPRAGKRATPGRLPFPDRNRDGNYDGKGDCVTFGLNASHLLGQLPWAGDFSPCPPVGLYIDVHGGAHGAGGENLWYAVSRNLVTRGAEVPVNSEIGSPGVARYPWIRLRDARGRLMTDPVTARPPPIAAVLIAPGPAVAGQDRGSGLSPAGEYLDAISISATTYSNADADGCADAAPAPCGVSNAGEEFIRHSGQGGGDAFNDQLQFITVDELMQAVEKRVLGEAAIALNAYRRSLGVYPWLARRRNARSLSRGVLSGAGADFIEDTAADFLAPGHAVQPGDTIISMADGGRATISSVTGTSAELAVMRGVTTKFFSAGEPYRIEASFNSTMARHGHLPVHGREEVFLTKFAATWKLDDKTPTTSVGHAGDAALIPPVADIESGSIQVAAGDGRCLWSDWTHADCAGASRYTGFFRADIGRTVTRTVEVRFSFADPVPVVSPPTTVDVRRRTLSTNGAPVSVKKLATPAKSAWNVRVTDDDGMNRGLREYTIDANTTGEITVAGIRFDLSVVYDGVDDERDELPEWFVEHRWHHLIQVAISRDAVAGGNGDGDGNCATPANTCLKLEVAGRRVRNDIQALLVSAGAALPHQDRSIGDCDGDGVPDAGPCAYFEGDNSDRSTPAAADTYTRAAAGRSFNDQIRIVEPPPP